MADTRNGFVIQDLDGKPQPFYRSVANHVLFGIRDQMNGNDRMVSDFIDARFSGSIPFDQVFARALSVAWRYPQGSAPLPLMVLKGWICGDMEVSVFEVDEWHRLENLIALSDGSSSCRSSGASTRRFKVVGDSRELYEIFRLEKSPWASVGALSAGSAYFKAEPETVPFGTLTFTLGVTDKDNLLKAAAAKAGLTDGSRAVLLILFAPDPGLAPAKQVGGPIRNHWRSGEAAIHHISYGHLSSYVGQAADEARKTDGFTDEKTWHDDGFRKEVFAALQEQLGTNPTGRQFLDTMAEGSPLRNLFTPRLVAAFPEIEQVFHANGEPFWDEMSPTERFKLLIRLTQEEETRLQDEVN